MTFPCFSKESLWFLLVNDDEESIDKTQVAIDCDNLQLGLNTFSIAMYEYRTWVSNQAVVLRRPNGIGFDFFDQTTRKKPVIYRFTATVTKKCSELKVLTP
jgi:hypothetical protein